MKRKVIYDLDNVFDFTNQFELWNRKEKRNVLINENEIILSVKKNNKTQTTLAFVWMFFLFIQILNAFLFQNILSLVLLFITLRISRPVSSTFYKWKREVNIGDHVIEYKYDYKKIRERTKKETFLYVLKVLFLGIDDDLLEPKLYRIKSVHIQPDALNAEYKYEYHPLVIYVAEIIE